MSNLANRFKEYKRLHTSKEIQLLKDFFDDKIKPGPAAKLFTKDISLKEKLNPLYDKSNTIISLAVPSFHLAIQENLVNLTLEIPNLRERSLSLGKQNSPYSDLYETDETISDSWQREYSYLL